MSLYCTGVDVNRLQESIERHVANVLVVVQQKSAENINGQHAQSALRLDVHNGQHRLVEYRVAHVFARLRVGGHLSEDVVHRLRGVNVVSTQNPQQSQDLHLQKRIGHTGYVVLRRVAGEDEILQNSHEVWHYLKGQIYY